MVYQWVQGWTSHYDTLKNINLTKHFSTENFPRFNTVDYNYKEGQEYQAIYGFDSHLVLFASKWLNNSEFWFSHTYFHELIHSSSHYNGRFHHIWMTAGPTNTKNTHGLEERIADVGAVILCLTFEPYKLDVLKTVYTSILINETNFVLPWGEIEEAVLFYVKDKYCPKLKEKIQYVKQVIMDNDLCSIHEGKFNGQLEEDIRVIA